MSLYDDTIAMFGLTAARRASFSRGPHAAKPCAMFAQPSEPRAGPRRAAPRILSRYAARVWALRSMIRAVTLSTRGCFMARSGVAGGRGRVRAGQEAIRTYAG